MLRRSPKKNSRRTKPRRLTLQQVESRQLMAADVGVASVDVQQIEGAMADAPPAIVLGQDGNDHFQTGERGDTKGFSIAPLGERVRFFQNEHTPDTIIGNHGNDFVSGGEGNDILVSGNGNDLRLD